MAVFTKIRLALNFFSEKKNKKRLYERDKDKDKTSKRVNFFKKKLTLATRIVQS